MAFVIVVTALIRYGDWYEHYDRLEVQQERRFPGLR